MGAQGGPWEAWPWPAEYGMYSQVERFVVRAHRMISTRVTGQVVEVVSSFYSAEMRSVCAGGELPYESIHSHLFTGLRRELARRIRTGVEGAVGEVPVLWLMQPGLNEGESIARPEIVVRKSATYFLRIFCLHSCSKNPNLEIFWTHRGYNSLQFEMIAHMSR